MSKKELSFDLGSRGLTAAETAVVENAKQLLLTSLGRHRKEMAVHTVFTVTSKAKNVAKPVAKVAAKPAAKKAAAKPARDVSVGGSAAWTSNKVASSIRKY